MSINLGNEAMAALRELSGSSQGRAILAGFQLAARQTLFAGLHSAVDVRVDQTAYARAVDDMAVAVEAALTGANTRLVTRQAPSKTGSKMGADVDALLDLSPNTRG